MAENTENTQVTNPVIGLDEVSQSLNSAPVFQSNPGTPIATRDAPIFSSTNLPDLYTSKFTPMPLSQAYRDIGGNALTGPNNNVTGSSIADYLNNASFANDPKFAGVNDIYGAANEGLRFAKAYNHSAFDRLGFSPYVDNTSKYLGYASGWEDFKTAIAPNRLFAAGMVDQATNWFEWNKPTDPAAARLMTDTMELYQTQRTGFWGGAANTMASLQYSAGAITEFALEELAIIGATAASGGTAGAGGFLRTARNVGALGRSIRVGSELLNTIRTVDRAKDFWQAARFAGVGAGKTANALLNPLYRTTSNVYDTYKGVKAGKTTAELAKNKAMFGDFFRDMSEINMALSEARLEGGITQNEIYDGIVKANPNITQADAEKAYKLSVQGGGENTMWNALTIYMTNKFVFDGLLGRMMPKSSRLLAAGEKMGGKFVMDNGKRVFLQDGFGKNIRRALLPISKEGKLYYKHLVQTGPSRLSNFTLAGTMEGLQENTQEMLNIAYTDYYTSLYNTPELAQSKGLRASLTKGLHEQFTSQGLQTFLSGFAIGGTLNQYGKALNWSLYKAPMIIADKTGMDKSYSTTKQSREEFRKQMVDTVNDMDNDPGSYFNAMENDLAHQVNFYDYTVAAQQVGDVKTTKNSQDMQLLKRVHTMFRSGNTDLLKDTFSNFLQMSDEDLQAAFPSYKLAGDETNAPLRNRLEDVIKKVDVMENSFKESQKLENPYNPYNIDKAKEPKKFNDEATKYLAFEEVRFDMAFLKTNLVLAHQYVDNILSKASENKPISNISGAAFTSILTENGIKTELDMLQKERQAYEQTAATSDKAAAKLAEIDNSIKMHENYLAAYEIYKDAKQKQPVDSVTRKSEITTDPVTGLVINPVTQELESKAVDLNSAFGALINQMGSAVNERPLSENVDAVFDSLREMIDHGVDISASIDALNLLYNPAGFEAHHSRIKTAMDNVHAMYKESNTKIFDELQHQKDLNSFLQRLMKKGIFFDPKHTKAFEDDSILPDSFIDKDTMMELDHTSPKYKDLLSAIDEFEKSTGKTLSGKTIPQYEDTFGALRVTRDVNDVRTMSTLSKQYSVSEDLVESSVSAEEILKAIASSPQALATEKLLAKRLGTIINKATKVTFVRNLTVPMSYSELTGVLVDLRYASIDYAGGVLKAEPIILSGILRNIVATELSTNDAFKAKLQDLLNIAKKNIFKDGTSVSQLPIGLDSLESFAAEALSNYSFQAALKAIDYTGERSSTQSLWSEFRKALSDFFAKLFNIPASTRQSLLDEVVDLTALNIDPKAATVGANPTSGSSTNSKPQGIKITQATPFEDIMAIPEYATPLRDTYNAMAIAQQQQDPSFAPTEESFKEWLLTSPLAANMIENLNLNTGRTLDDPNSSQLGSTQSNGNSATMSGEVISEEDYRTFQQTQQVSDDVLNEIKSRMEMGKALTPRQHEIFTLYGDVIREAISQQKAIDQASSNVDETIKAEIARLTVPQIYGNAPSPYIGGGDGQFTLVFGGQVNAYQLPDGSYTAIVYQNITQEQVLAGASPKGYPVSSILASTEASYAPLQDALRPIQQAVDAIVARNTAPAVKPVTTTTTSTDVQANRDIDMFPETSNFAQSIGESESVLENEIKKARLIEKDEKKAQELEAELERRRSKISAYTEVNGIGISEYTNPISGVVDVIMSGTSDNDYVGYVRLYINDKPTDRWTSKMSNESDNKEAFKTMLSEVQSRLPVDHEYTESTNISLEGLKLYAQQLNRGYEVLTDAKGNPVMSSVSLNAASKEGLRNAKSQEEKEDLYEPITVATREEFDKIKEEILASMPNARVSYNQANNTVNIQLPVLKKKAGPTTTTTTKEVITPEGFTNRVFESNLQLGEASADDHISEEGYNYRTLSQTEIDAIIESGGVFSREGKQRGGNKNTKYWTKGNNKNWYGDKDTTETIRVNQKNFKENEVVKAEDVEVYNKVTKQFEPLLARTTTKTEPEKTEEQQVDEDINGNPETRDEVQDGMSGIDNASTEVTSELDELERRSREGKTAPITERAKETLDQVRSSVTQILDSMKSSYAKMGPQMANGYEKLRRAHKKTAGKIREKIKDLLDKIMRFMRKLQTMVKATYDKVSKRPKSNLPSITNELPVVRPTGLEQVDNSVDQLSDYITSLLDTYGFTAFFNASGFTVDQDVIKNIDTLSTKFGDAKILGYASPMEIVTHKLVHAFVDKKVKGSEIEKFDKKAQVRINTLRTLLGDAIENGQTYSDILDNLNYVYDKSPAQQLAAYFLTNRRFRTIVSRLSPDAYRSLEILTKDMTGFTDAKVRKFISLQDGLDMADDMYDNFEANSSQSPMTIVAEALDTAGPENLVGNIAAQLATPIEEIIYEEATEEELQEIANSEKKLVPEIVSDIKNTVIRYLTSVKFGKNKTPIDAAPRTKKEGIIRRIWNKLKKLVIAFGAATTMFAAEGSIYVAITGYNMNTTTEGEVSKPAWAVSNSIDNTLNYLPIPDSYKQSMLRGFIQYGLYDINNVREDVDGAAIDAQAVKESEDRLQYIQENTYFDSLGVNKDGLGGPTDSLLKYRNQWFNDVGFEYLAAPSNSTRDRVGQMTFDNTVGVAHFYIMDDTGGDLSRYTSAEKIAEAREVFKKRVGTYDVKLTDYVPVFKYMPQNEQGENIVRLQYKIASELTNDDIAITKLLQWKYSEIDWASKHRLYNAANCLTTKAGNKAQSFTFSTKAVDDQGKPIDPKDLYSRFSGSTIVFIFKDPKGNTIVREFTGSINNIKREGENIMKDFKVEPEDLTIGAFDAGSYSGKPVSKKGVLDTNQWDGFNKIHPNAGSALVIPVSSTRKTIQLSDIQATNAQIDQVINEKTKACKL